MPDGATTGRASYDLHLHSCWSYDAMVTPQALVETADALGIRRIAITDHHVVDGVEEAREAARDHPDVTLVAGAELTVNTSIGAVDTVCLGVTPEAIDALTPIWDAYHQWQQEFGAALRKGISALGHDFTESRHEDLLRSYRPARCISEQGMTHIGGSVLRAWLIERGIMDSPEDWGPLMAAAAEQVPRPAYPAADFVVPAVKRDGAIVAIAHPTRYFLRDDRERMETLREELLLDAVECAHPGVPPELTRVYRRWCVEHGLLSTGSSDLHFPEALQASMGRHIGSDEWWDELAERLPAESMVNA